MLRRDDRREKRTDRMHELTEQHVPLLPLQRDSETRGLHALNAGAADLGLLVLDLQVLAVHLAHAAEKGAHRLDALEEDGLRRPLVGLVRETREVDGLAAVPTQDEPLFGDLGGEQGV